MFEGVAWLFEAQDSIEFCSTWTTSVSKVHVPIFKFKYCLVQVAMLCRRHAGVSCFFSMDYCRRCVSGVSSCHRWKLNQSLVARGTSKQVVVTKWPWFPAHARRTQECAKVAMDTRCCVRVLGSSFDVAMICLDMPSNEWGKSRKGHKNSDSPDVGQIINHGGILYSMHPTSLIAYYNDLEGISNDDRLCSRQWGATSFPIMLGVDDKVTVPGLGSNGAMRDEGVKSCEAGRGAVGWVIWLEVIVPMTGERDGGFFCCWPYCFFQWGWKPGGRYDRSFKSGLSEHKTSSRK